MHICIKFKKMIFELKNEILEVKIDSLGAELQSIIQLETQTELLWQANPQFWSRRSPILFPTVGRLKNDCYTLSGKEYTMQQHGFARNHVFEVEQVSMNCLEFRLSQNEKTLAQYPFQFELKIRYELVAAKIQVSYLVQNPSEIDLPFSIGAHPAFRCPLFAEEDFSDYFIHFSEFETVDRHLLNNGLFTGETSQVLRNEKELKLNYSDFESDAIVFKNLNSRRLTLENTSGSYALVFEFINFQQFGIWTKPQAPFLCLEPWNGFADSVIGQVEFKDKPGLIHLKSNETFTCQFSATFLMRG